MFGCEWFVCVCEVWFLVLCEDPAIAPEGGVICVSGLFLLLLWEGGVYIKDQGGAVVHMFANTYTRYVHMKYKTYTHQIKNMQAHIYTLCTHQIYVPASSPAWWLASGA